jgi:hypothetical protein
MMLASFVDYEAILEIAPSVPSSLLACRDTFVATSDPEISDRPSPREHSDLDPRHRRAVSVRGAWTSGGLDSTRLLLRPASRLNTIISIL